MGSQMPLGSAQPYMYYPVNINENHLSHINTKINQIKIRKMSMLLKLLSLISEKEFLEKIVYISYIIIVNYAKNTYKNLANVNSPDFSLEIKKARFFVIKSFTEDDVHKSMKYVVWSSTNEGNKRLNEAFASSLSEKIPVFLFFRYFSAKIVV